MQQRFSRFGVAIVGALFLSGCVAPSQAPPPDPARDSAILAVLDRYMDGLNALDIETHVSAYHFPHYRHASRQITVWASAEEAMPILRVPRAERREILRRMLEPEWDRSEWTRRDIVQASPDKVHVATTFVRLRADGSVIKTFDSLYVMTLEANSEGDLRWGIKGRSSFAP